MAVPHDFASEETRRDALGTLAFEPGYRDPAALRGIFRGLVLAVLVWGVVGALATALLLLI